jgi:serine/threonine protein kinase
VINKKCANISAAVCNLNKFLLLACTSQVKQYVQVVLIFCVPTRQDDGTWLLVLEYCGRGTLDTLLHHSSSLAHAGGGGGRGQRGPAAADLSKVLPLARGVARGMMHLHSRRPPILHRDLKPGGCSHAEQGHATPRLSVATHVPRSRY